MPGGMNGWELAREAARRRPGLKLFTSGFPEAAFGRDGTLPEGALQLARTLRAALAA
ncbi:MAG TPA: hypothetical protein VEX11_01665 [Acetobacteraceae bacterium]|nr:hypothetical protein [Acetobacteraceae bacterium]